MKRFICLVILCLGAFMLISCGRISNPSVTNCHNFRCEITQDNETFIFSGDDARDINSKCNEYERSATHNSEAFGSGECIKIVFMGDKCKEPKRDSDTVVFYTYTIYENDIVYFDGTMDFKYEFASGFYQTIDFMIFLKKQQKSRHVSAFYVF